MSQTTNNHDEGKFAWGRPGNDSSATNQAPAAQASASAGQNDSQPQTQPTGQEYHSPRNQQEQTMPNSQQGTSGPESGAQQHSYGQSSFGQQPQAPQYGQQAPQGNGQPAYGQQAPQNGNAAYGQQTQQVPQNNGHPTYGQAPQNGHMQNGQQAPQYGQAPQNGQQQPHFEQAQQYSQPQSTGPSTSYGTGRPDQAPTGQNQTGQTQGVPAEQTTWHSPYARPQENQVGYGGAGPQTLTAYPAQPTTADGMPTDSSTGAVPVGGFGSGGLPPTEKKRRNLGQPGWRGVIAVGLGAALIASLLTAGVVVATRDDDTATSALATTSSNSDSQVEAPVTGSTSENPDWTAVAAAVSPSVVAVQVTSQSAEGEGSGVILDTDGRIVTNYHVVNGVGSNATIEVVLNDGRKYSASVVGSDSTTDLAVIQLEDPPDDLTPITMGSTDSVAVGDSVMAVGNPLGLAGTVTTGIVSALDRPVTTTQTSTDDSQQGFGSSSSADSEDVVTNAIQTDAAVNPGNSGGALVNAQGELIGINSSIAALSSSSAYGDSSESGSIGLGFAIPVDEVKSVANQLIADGTAEHSWLGVSVSDTTVTIDSADRDGAQLADIVSDSPAEDAGLKADDVVIAVDGTYINGAESLVAQLRERTPGTEVTLTIVRDGKSQDVKVTLGTRPDSAS